MKIPFLPKFQRKLQRKLVWGLCSLCSLCSLYGASSAHAQIALDSPAGGWKTSSGESAQHTQDVHYPASRVNAGAQRFNEDGRGMGALIRGQIRGQPKSSRKPHLLVVNGVAMPLGSDEGGNFARPYAFGPGANNVEIRSADRSAVRRVTFYDTNTARKHLGLRVVLSWDTDMTDLDLHVISPDGQHVWYGKRQSANGGGLDQDVTGGYGPEIYAAPSPPKGNWHIYVNYFGGFSADEATKPVTVAQVALIQHEGTADEKREVFQVPMRRPGELTLVKSFSYP
jgi:uncharacterized protein YfaP (DUF2135 family)